MAPSHGQAAVEKAADEGAMSQADVAPSVSSGDMLDEAADQVRTVGAKTFVRSGSMWMDTAYDPQTMETQKVSFLSEEYFALAASRPEAGAALALGERVIVVIDGMAYEVVSEGEEADEVDLPEAAASQGNGESSGLGELFGSLIEEDEPDDGLGGLLPCSSAGALLAMGVWMLVRRR